MTLLSGGVMRDAGPWAVLALAGVGVEAWAYRHRPSMLLTRVARRAFRVDTMAGRVAVAAIAGWVVGHVVTTDTGHAASQ